MKNWKLGIRMILNHCVSSYHSLLFSMSLHPSIASEFGSSKAIWLK